MNEAARRAVAAELIQRRWRAKLDKRANRTPTVPAGEVSAHKQTEGTATGPKADEGGGQQADEMPPGLTKMQQMAWKKKQEKKQQAQ